MDKNRIKAILNKRFLSEEETPGISVTNAAKKESGKFNKAGVEKIAKDSLDYNKGLKQDSETSKMATNKYNYTNDAEKTYHDEMEILNGQEMIKYASEPGKEFSQRAKEGIEGSSRMGNKGGKGMGNAEETFGASSDDFGKNLVKRVKDSERKRAIADAPIDSLTSLGDKIAYPNDKVSVTPDKTAMSGGVGKNNKGDMTPQTKSAITKTKIKTVNENNNDKTKEESMKRLKFKNPFNGFGNALKVIPEGYKIDKREFEMTDGNETYRIRWEGSLNEGKAIILAAKDNKLVNEDVARMKVLFGYKSEDTLGTVKGKNRIDENAAFADIWKKSRILLGESEDIEDETAKEGDLDDAVKSAPEAKKDINGSVSTDKGTTAPKPKTGTADSLDKAVKVAKEATRDIEGSVATTKKTEAPAPKVGEWEEINIPQAAAAKKHIENGNPTGKATDTAKVVKENDELGDEDVEDDTTVATEPVETDDDDAEEKEDTFFKSDADDTDTEKEPEAKDIAGEVPPAVDASIPKKTSVSILKSPSNPGKLWIKVNGKPEEIPAQYMEIAKSGNPNAAKIILDKMEVDAAGEVEGGEEENEM